MTKRFAPGAGRLAGVSARLLGWPPDWFWRATPTEVAAIFAADTSTGAPGLSRDDLRRLMEQEGDG